jgi:hypothetical protein
MFANTTKAIIGALVLTSVSFAVTASAYSAPRQAPSQAAEAWMDRASNPNTNGFWRKRIGTQCPDAKEGGRRRSRPPFSVAAVVKPMPGAGRRIPVALNRQSGVNLGAPIGGASFVPWPSPVADSSNKLKRDDDSKKVTPL